MSAVERESAERLAAVRGRIADAAVRAGRRPDEVTLVGASKRIAAERVAAAVAAGLADLGENYVQEARGKIAQVAARVPVAPRWHGIGALQRNKAKEAVGLFEMIHTVDRASLATSLARHAAAAGRALPVLLQVNLSREPQKAGAAEEELPALLAACAGLEGLAVRGLMAIPAPGPGPEATRPAFARLRALRERLRATADGRELVHLSMGMSADFEVAIEEGATIVRVGTALFGPRPD